jgi:hypothetical protein
MAASGAGKSSAGVGLSTPVLVNAAFVHHYFANQNPLGKMLTEGNGDVTIGDSAVGKPKSRRWEIVGIVGDTKVTDLRREVHPLVYVPLTGGGAHFEVRTALNPSALIPAVRDLAKRIDSNLPLFGVRTQSESIEGLVTQERMIARLASFFGLLALLLASVGLYGLLSYEVTRRTREIGIRMSGDEINSGGGVRRRGGRSCPYSGFVELALRCQAQRLADVFVRCAAAHRSGTHCELHPRT